MGKWVLVISNKNRNDGNIVFELTELCKRILNLRYKQRQLEFVKLILKHRAFHDYLRLYFENSEKPTTWDTIDIMKYCDLYKIESESTYKRRASTIRGWVEWILELTRI